MQSTMSSEFQLQYNILHSTWSFWLFSRTGDSRSTPQRHQKYSHHQRAGSMGPPPPLLPVRLAIHQGCLALLSRQPGLRGWVPDRVAQYLTHWSLGPNARKPAAPPLQMTLLPCGEAKPLASNPRDLAHPGSPSCRKPGAAALKADESCSIPDPRPRVPIGASGSQNDGDSYLCGLFLCPQRV